MAQSDVSRIIQAVLERRDEAQAFLQKLYIDAASKEAAWNAEQRTAPNKDPDGEEEHIAEMEKLADQIASQEHELAGWTAAYKLAIRKLT